MFFQHQKEKWAKLLLGDCYCRYPLAIAHDGKAPNKAKSKHLFPYGIHLFMHLIFLH